MQINQIIILLLFVVSSCNSKSSDNTERSMNDPGRSISELKELALEKGDTNAYETLSIAYLDYPSGEFFPIALKMANKYDYTQAYYDCYMAILDYNGVYSPDKPLDRIDLRTRNLAIEYLISGAMKGHEQSIETLKDYYLKDTLNRELILTKKIKDEFGEYLNQLMRDK